jgi:cbb3-type cytochrome oxidase subunit 3
VKLSDVMSGAGLAGFAEAGLLIFFLCFVAVAIRAFLPRHKSEMEALRLLPLTDGSEPNGAEALASEQRALKLDAQEESKS